MQKRDGQGKAGAHTESGEEEAKGGAKMQKINREDVVQAALIVERWCEKHYKHQTTYCDCPFSGDFGCELYFNSEPWLWALEEFLRDRGRKHGKV